MSAEKVNIEMLRCQLEQARPGTLGAEMLAFMNLVDHPELQWNDLLNALCRPGLISEDAALRLHKLLKVPRDGIRVNSDRGFWEKILEEAGISRSDKVVT